VSVFDGTMMYFTLKKMAEKYVYSFGAALPKYTASYPGRL
jgi:hypothetical protein